VLRFAKSFLNKARKVGLIDTKTVIHASFAVFVLLVSALVIPLALVRVPIVVVAVAV